MSYLVKSAILHRRDTKEGIRAALDEAGRSEIARMERRFVMVAAVAQTAPLLGLLGTVLVMIQAVLAMQQQAPLVQSEHVLAWLRQALVTTAAGLTVAIPCYLAHHFLTAKVENIVQDMERAASEVLAFLADPANVNPAAPAARKA